MFFLTSVADLKNSRPSRCFGYFKSLNKALNAVSKNTGNMVECFYDYLILEEIGEGIHALSKEIMWFKYDLVSNSWEKCKKPKWAVCCNWAIG